MSLPGVGLEDTARLVAIAGVLGTLTVLVYRLGVWRQEMEHTKQHVVAEMKAHREAAEAHFDRVERRLEAIDHVLSTTADHRARAMRWQSRAERRFERLEQVLAQNERPSTGGE